MRRWLLVLSFGFLAVSLERIAGATDAPADVYAYRHQVMEGLGKHMKAASMIAKGQIQRPKEDLVMHAQALHDGGLVMASLFPQGSGPDQVKETAAKAEVWSKWTDFETKVKAYNVETGKLLELAKSGDSAGFQAQFSNVGKSCGSCHDAFRVEDE